MAFEAAAEKVKNLVSSPSNDELLELYALYKQVSIFPSRVMNSRLFILQLVSLLLQGTVGDNTTSKPGMFDMKGKAKWSAWDGKKGEII